MRVLGEISSLGEISGPVVVAAGVFDGMHLGHLAVIGEAVREAAEIGGTPVALTFDPHPLKVLRPLDAPRLLTSTAQKLSLMHHAGIRAALVVSFDPEFAATPAADFVNRLASSARPLAAICVGEGWRFGRDREGDGVLLRTLGERLGFSAVEVPPVRVENLTVSSTMIRQALAGGDLASAQRMLGREFSVTGRVVRGEGIGRTLGFPTANLEIPDGQLPADGVYAVRLWRDGQPLPGVANIGFRPTLAGATRTFEVHLFGEPGDLYDATVEVAFVSRLRDERKFGSLEELKQQIAKDCLEARAVTGAI